MIDDVYNAKILGFAGNIARIGRLDRPDATATAHSKLCGSTVTVDLNMRDGVWYEGDVSGNTPMTWDSENSKWTTSYNPDTWPDKGVKAGANPDYVEPPTPVP